MRHAFGFGPKQNTKNKRTSWRRLTDCLRTLRATSSANASGSDASSTSRTPPPSTGGGEIGAGAPACLSTDADTGLRPLPDLPDGGVGGGSAAWARTSRVRAGVRARPRTGAMVFVVVVFACRDRRAGFF